MLRSGWGRVQTLGAGAALSFLLALTGCGAFFSCEGKADCGTGSGSTTTGTGDYVYVSNSTSGSTYINGYQIGSGALTAISGFPLNLNYVPVAMAVSKNDSFLYVAAAPGTSNSGLWVYSIASSGAVSGGTHLTSDLIGAMALSPDGNFLFELDSGTGTQLTEYSLSTSSGATTFANSFATAGGGTLLACNPTSGTPASQVCGIAVSPSNDLVAVALNTNGVEVFPYTSSGGITATSPTTVISAPNSGGDYSLAFDGSDNLYVAVSTGTPASALLTYPKGSTSTSNNYPYTTASAVPRSVALSSSYGYVYTANEGNGYVQAFTLTSGTPTVINAAGFVGPTSVAAVGAERSGAYLVAAGYNTSNGLQLMTISATGLSAVATQGTSASTSVPVVMALTH